MAGHQERIPGLAPPERSPMARRYRGAANRVAALVVAVHSHFDRLEADGVLRAGEADAARQALDRLLADARRRLAGDEQQANRNAWRKRVERRVLAGLANLRISQVTVDIVATRVLNVPPSKVTHSMRGELGKILSRAGWVQTRPRGPGSTRQRVYVEPMNDLFAKAGWAK